MTRLTLFAALLALVVSGCPDRKDPGGTKKPVKPTGGGTSSGGTPSGGAVSGGERVDDWVFKGSSGAMRRRSMARPAASAKMGLAVGGAKSVGNFRQNIKNKFLPLPTDEAQISSSLKSQSIRPRFSPREPLCRLRDTKTLSVF